MNIFFSFPAREQGRGVNTKVTNFHPPPMAPHRDVLNKRSFHSFHGNVPPQFKESRMW